MQFGFRSDRAMSWSRCPDYPFTTSDRICQEAGYPASICARPLARFEHFGSRHHSLTVDPQLPEQIFACSRVEPSIFQHIVGIRLQPLAKSVVYERTPQKSISRFSSKNEIAIIRHGGLVPEHDLNGISR
jgi:hypothetical protein